MRYKKINERLSKKFKFRISKVKFKNQTLLFLLKIFANFSITKLFFTLHLLLNDFTFFRESTFIWMKTLVVSVHLRRLISNTSKSNKMLIFPSPTLPLLSNFTLNCWKEKYKEMLFSERKPCDKNFHFEPRFSRKNSNKVIWWPFDRHFDMKLIKNGHERMECIEK